MQEIRIQSFAKVNLSIDVVGVRPDGMHLVDMVMQQLSFHDDVHITYVPEPERPRGSFEIALTTNRFYLPTDGRNLAYRAAALMAERFGADRPGGRIAIDLFKRIPVAAGLAGGSGNGAAVLHGLNYLWRLGLSMETLCALGATLGSDVPFCVMGQARCNFHLDRQLRRDPLAAACARATGTGTALIPLPALRAPVVIAKPGIGVSTREVYGGIDGCVINTRPDNDRMEKALRDRARREVTAQCVNVLEAYTLTAYPQVAALRALLAQAHGVDAALMSGSGPTVFGIFHCMADAKTACAALRKQGYEAYWTRTTK